MNRVAFLKRVAVIAALIVLATSPVMAQTPPKADAPAAENETPSPPREVAVQPRVRDTQIAKRLGDILSATGWFIDPSVEVREGVVFLDGETTQDRHRAWATRLAESTQEVVAVVNRMELRPEVRWDYGFVVKEIDRLAGQMLSALPLIVVVVLILILTVVVTWAVAWLARRALSRRIASPLLLQLAARAVAFPALLLGLYFILQVSNLTGLALTLLGGTGIAGLIIGFAFRDIVENFLASFLLSLRNPFRTGDYILVDGSEGVVQNLNTRSTVLLTLDGNHVQIPNAVVFKSKIVNYSSNPYRRDEFTIAIAGAASISTAQNEILTMLEKHEAVLKQPEPLVLVEGLGASSITLKVRYWYDSKVFSPVKIKSSLLRLTKRTLAAAGVALPDEARQLVLAAPAPSTMPTGERDVAAAAAPPPASQPGPFAAVSDGAEASKRRKQEADLSAESTAAEGGLSSEKTAVAAVADRNEIDDEENLLSDAAPEEKGDKAARKRSKRHG